MTILAVTAPSAGPRRAGARDWAGLAVLALPCLLVSMDAHVLNLALPALAAELRPTSVQLLWIVDGYAFLLGGALMTMGALGDRIGRRRLLLAGGAAFGCASVLAAFATSAAMLIAARALLGIAGATLMPSTLSLIRTMFRDARDRTVALGVWTASFALGGVLAPVIAGLLLQAFWWGSVFLVAVPLMALLVVLGPVLLPEFRDPGAARVDALSAGLSLLAVLGAVYGLKRVAQGDGDAGAGLALAGGLVLGALFVRRQVRQADPWVDLALFRRLRFTLPLATNALCFFVLYGTQFFVALYLQLVLGLSPLHAGLWTIPSALGYLAGSVLGPIAARREPHAWLMGASVAVAATGFGLLTQVGPGSGLAVVVAGTVVFSVGLAPVYVLSTEMTVAAAPPERAGGLSALVETCADLGGALGIAVLGSLGAAVYRHAVPGSAGDLAGARGEGAREAFTLAFQVVEGVGAGLLAVVAVAAVAGLRLRRRGAGPW